ncbi:MAG: hypothetical protein IPK67_04700 [Planctomycetes bacterium]|nr:hypothetical protein [Planctomycetota bacterium]
MDPGPHATATAGLRASLDSGELILLIQAVAGGRPQALADLYDRTSRQVFALAYRVLKDRQVAEEVVLDVFLQVWRSAQGYDVARARPWAGSSPSRARGPWMRCAPAGCACGGRTSWRRGTPGSNPRPLRPSAWT